MLLFLYQVVNGDHMQDTSGKSGAPLGNVDAVSLELAESFTPGSIPKKA